MKACSSRCDLESCILCTLCLKDWLPALEVQRKNFEVKKGQPVFVEGEVVSGIYFVYKGTIKVHKKWDNEKQLITRFATQGDMIGHLGLGDDPLYPVSATALETSIVCYLDMKFFKTTLNVNAHLSYKLLRFLATELQATQKIMRNLAHMSVKARIAQAFISIKEQFGIDKDGYIGIDLTRQDIASFAGSSYETLFKVINEFTDSRIVEIIGKRISIINENALLLIVNNDNLQRTN